MTKVRPPHRLKYPSVETIRTESSVADVDVIRRGYAWPVAHRLQGETGLSDPRFASFLGVSSRTLARLRKSSRKLDPIASDRLYRLMRVIRLAASVFEDEDNGIGWLKESQPGLGWRVPMDILDTEPGFEAVETLLMQIDYGVVI